MELLPLGLPQHLVCGDLDQIVPADLSTLYADAARRAGDTVEVDIVEGAGHFELVRPGSVTWPVIVEALKGMVGASEDPAPVP